MPEQTIPEVQEPACRQIQIYLIVVTLLSNRRCKIISLPANTNNTLVKRPINIFLLLYHLVFWIIDFLFTCEDNNGKNKYYECLTIKRSSFVNIVTRPLLLWPVWKQIGIRILWSGSVKYLSRPICDNEMIYYGQTTLGRTSFSTHCVGHSNLNLHR